MRSLMIRMAIIIIIVSIIIITSHPLMESTTSPTRSPATMACPPSCSALTSLRGRSPGWRP